MFEKKDCVRKFYTASHKSEHEAFQFQRSLLYETLPLLLIVIEFSTITLQTTELSFVSFTPVLITRDFVEFECALMIELYMTRSIYSAE